MTKQLININIIYFVLQTILRVQQNLISHKSCKFRESTVLPVLKGYYEVITSLPL